MSIVSLAVIVLTTCGYVLLCLLSSKLVCIIIQIVDNYVTIILHAAPGPRDNCTKNSDHTTGNILQDTNNVIDSRYALSSTVAEVNYLIRAALCTLKNVFFIRSGIHIMPCLVNMKMQQLIHNELAGQHMPAHSTNFADRNFECMHLDTQIIT